MRPAVGWGLRVPVGFGLACRRGLAGILVIAWVATKEPLSRYSGTVALIHWLGWVGAVL